MRKGNILPIAVMAFALVAFLFVVDYSIGDGKWPWSVNAERTATNTANTNTTTDVNTSVNTNSVSNVNTSTNTNTVSTADWKTYTNSTYGFSIKYPTDYRQASNSNGNTSALFEKGSAGYTGYSWLSISGFQVKDSNSQDVANVLLWAKNGFPKNDPVTTYHANPRNVVLGGKNFVLTDGDTASSGYPEYLIYQNDTLYWFTTSTNAQEQKSIREIIATLTFSSPTADWMTYTNDELDIKFQYPPSWGTVAVKKIDATMNVNQTGAEVSSGKAVQINFVDSAGRRLSGAWMQASSSDFKQFMSPSYIGGEDLTKGCSNPGVVGENSFCILRTVAGIQTVDNFYYEAPECSPNYIREVRLNLSGSDYAGLRIASNYSSKVDCVSSDANIDQTKQTELTHYLNRTNLSATELQRLEDFDTLLSTFSFTK